MVEKMKGKSAVDYFALVGRRLIEQAFSYFKQTDHDLPASILAASNMTSSSPDFPEQVLQVLLAADKEFGPIKKKTKKKEGALLVQEVEVCSVLK